MAKRGPSSLREGLLLPLYSNDLDDKGQPDELLVDGVVSFSEEEHCWVASIDCNAIQHASEERDSRANGLAKQSATSEIAPANRPS